jgi:RNA polymerase sigma factor (sigma-70 family)
MTTLEISQATLDKAKAGDAASLDFVLNIYRRLIYWWCNKACKQSGKWTWLDDLVSRSFTSVLNAVKTYDKDKGTFSCWATYYIRGTINGYIKTQSRDPDFVDISEYENSLVDEERLCAQENSECAEDLDYLLSRASLTSRDATILKFRYIHGYLLEEIADEYYLTHEGVRQVLKRAFEKLQAAKKALDLEEQTKYLLGSMDIDLNN